jgi:hypothetical protein
MMSSLYVVFVGPRVPPAIWPGCSTVIEKVRGGKAGVSLFVSMPSRYALPLVTSLAAASVFSGVT